jgi:hypothetical protein
MATAGQSGGAGNTGPLILRHQAGMCHCETAREVSQNALRMRVRLVWSQA